MSEAQFAFALQRPLLVDGIAVFFDNPDRNLALRSSDRNGETGHHILSNTGRGTTQWDELIAGSGGLDILFCRVLWTLSRRLFEAAQVALFVVEAEPAAED